ncbi:MAG: hypothetical protein ACWGPS_10885 [Candidatus Promineifilaceae bacterium]
MNQVALRKMRRVSRTLGRVIAVTGMLLLAVAIGPASAHTEGKMQLASEPAGAFKLTVWTSPDPAEVGPVHVASAVVLAEDASPVLDAQVFVEVTPKGAAESTLRAQATSEDSTNKFLYEAVLEVTEPGSYQVTVSVEGSDGSTGSASFELEVMGGGGFNWWLLIPLGLVVVAGGVYFVARRPAGD